MKLIVDDKKNYNEDSNNAEPVNSGRCCNNCNEEVVIPHRIAEVLK